jgi:hypothetical protein
VAAQKSSLWFGPAAAATRELGSPEQLRKKFDIMVVIIQLQQITANQL